MYIQKGTFKIDEFESVELEGHYDISLMNNEQYVYNPDSIDERNVPNQAVCVRANVLYRTDTENLNELIKVIMRYTHDPCVDLELDRSIESSEVMMGGTICPRKWVLFIYKSKVFVMYGRYIFGYDYPYVKIHRVNSVSDTPGSKCDGGDTSVDNSNAESEDSDADTGSSKSFNTEDDDSLDSNFDSDEDAYEEEKRLDDKITKNDIVLSTPDYAKDCNEYVYSFMIYDKNSNVLDAFGLYR